MQSSPKAPKIAHSYLILIGIALATAAAYIPVLRAGFLDFDDGLYVTQEPMVYRGLSWNGVVFAFHSSKGGIWHPLVWLSHMAICQLFSLNPLPHHLVNLLIHISAALILFIAVQRMTGAVWRSGLVASLFALHPMHVESVAWISERKDVLSGLCFALTLLAYANYVGSGKRRSYILTLVAFVLGLMCKPILVTVPILLLLLDWWPLKREGSLWSRIVEKIPFFVLSIAGCFLAVWSQAQARSISTDPLGLHIENIVVSYMQYFTHLFWPVNLAPFYPFPNSIPIWQAALSAFILVAVTAATVRWGKTRPYLLVGWLWFLITLMPVIGILHIGMQAWADRYSYIPYIGLGLAISWAVGDIIQSHPRWTTPLSTAFAGALACCIPATFVQARYWHDTKTLFQHTLAVTSDNYYAHAKLGAAALREGDLKEAEKHHEEELRLLPNFANSYLDIGLVYAAKGELNAAAMAFARAVALNPAVPSGHYNLGHAYDLLGRHEEAVAQFQAALRLNPNEVVAQQELGSVLLKLNKPREALPYCQAAAKVITNDAHLIFSIAYAFQAMHQPEKAIENYQRALRLNPDLVEALNGLAWIYATSPRAEIRNGPEAIRLALHACELTQRRKPDPLDTLAAAYAESGRFTDAQKVIEGIKTNSATTNNPAVLEMAKQRLILYESGRPMREE